MALFKKPIFSGVFSQSNNRSAQNKFEQGVLHLNMGDYSRARDLFTEADKTDHVSASYNLMLIHGAGYLSPYSIDLAALYYYKAVKLGHGRALKNVSLLEAADRGGFGADNLVTMLAGVDASNADALPSEVMVYACRFFSVICEQHEATAHVVAYELDCASFSDMAAVHKFIQRTGVPKAFYEGGEHGLVEGSAADHITSSFNNLYAAMKHAGYSDELCILMRCTIIGYIISKSSLGKGAKPLLGRDQFFAAKSSTKEEVSSTGKPPANALTGLEYPAEILLVTQSGKALMTSESLARENHAHMDGAVFEIMVKMRNGVPFFIYYKCEEYYFMLMQPGSILEAQKAEQWRAEVSRKALEFLREFILQATQEDIGPRMISYHHNAKHTNVVAYVERLDGWYPIQQSENDHEDTTELRVAAVNSGTSSISEFIAVSDLSPSA